MTVDKELMPVLDGRPGVFDREWPVRMADIDRDGRLRLDAAAFHIQDIGQVNCARGAFNRSSRCGSSVAP